MVLIDILILAVLAVSALLGLFRGLVKEALSLATWCAAILAGWLFSPRLAEAMSGLINHPGLLRVSAFAVLFIGLMFIGTAVANQISGWIRAAGLSGVDRVLGGLFGLLRGFAIVIAAVLLALQFPASESWFQGSILAPYAEPLMSWAQSSMGLA